MNFTSMESRAGWLARPTSAVSDAQLSPRTQQPPEGLSIQGRNVLKNLSPLTRSGNRERIFRAPLKKSGRLMFYLPTTRVRFVSRVYTLHWSGRTPTYSHVLRALALSWIRYVNA
jgi:hypothetical protein